MNNIIATGHVMRCLAIAEGFAEAGEECTFILADDFAKEFIEGFGHKVIVLDTIWNKLDGEIDIMRRLIRDNNIRQMIVDSYYVTEKYLSELNKCTSVAYIDDLNAFTYPVDVLIVSGIWIDFEEYKKQYKGKQTKLLLGTEYAPIRKEFREVNASYKYIDVMITTGGTDTFNVAGRLIENIRESHPEWKVIVISSRLSEEMETENIKIRSNVRNMSEIMSSSKVAISASGSTLYELCSCKTPTVCFAFADNQLEFAAEMKKRGIMEYVGDARIEEDIIEKLVVTATNLLNNPIRQFVMQDKMAKLVDGKGVMRIVEELKEVCRV
ncbi:MAG: UDP-2,4-diacetamido-2,4,6-trideoxy-beta-L-altropyranose hydrolase [Lachnospiraceae bacterium]|nr:UDP-2,4-diacetamido-2,4,6-trideoxy-beta-L-altropyranose hydrolase [Lachnospiraceae bacterium]